MKNFKSNGKKRQLDFYEEGQIKSSKLKSLNKRSSKNWKNSIFQEEDFDEEEIFLRNRGYEKFESED
jgi:hypothetical protein